MERKDTPITEEYVNTLIAIGGLGLIAGFIFPFGLAMVIGVNVSITERIIGILLLSLVGLLTYFAVRIWKKYERQKQGGDKK